MPTLGSLFDGIGGFPLAALHNGITPLWASEIEPFPIEVTRLRFPDMLHVGDITKLNGADLPPVDIITGGSPCQDLSVAGARAGLAGARSGLFMEQVRIVKEMRNADERRGRTAHAVRPRYMCWENVPGVFSSAEGEDFRIVLEEIVRVKDSTCSVPGPDSGTWESAGAIILGDQFSLAWRVLDAQYWGVAQRRKRIFLVADFAGRSAPKILFEQDSLSGNPAQGTNSWKGTATAAKGSTETPGRIAAAGFSAGAGSSAGGIGYGEEVAPTLKGTASGNCMPSILCLSDQGGSAMACSEDLVAALRAQEHGHQPLVFENHGIDARYTGPHKVAPTMSARYGTGGNNVPLVAQKDDIFCITGNAIDRQPMNGGNGIGYQRGIAYTLTAADHHAVFSRQRVDVFRDDAVASTQSARQHKDATDLVMNLGEPDNSPSAGKDAAVLLIRRLTPLECERLQGFPDGWTDIEGASDSARYKALGNSVAIPCVDYVLQGVAWAIAAQAN